MDWHAAALVAAPLVGGWVFSVERRISRLLALVDNVKETREDVREVRNYLLGERKG